MENIKLICNNPWCKTTFTFQVSGENVEYPKDCPKCQSFDTELSGGVTWKEKQYEGSRWEGPHQISYKIKKYF
jgi:hypothetical protein